MRRLFRTILLLFCVFAAHGENPNKKSKAERDANWTSDACSGAAASDSDERCAEERPCSSATTCYRNCTAYKNVRVDSLLRSNVTGLPCFHASFKLRLVIGTINMPIRNCSIVATGSCYSSKQVKRGKELLADTILSWSDNSAKLTFKWFRKYDQEFQQWFLESVQFIYREVDRNRDAFTQHMRSAGYNNTRLTARLDEEVLSGRADRLLTCETPQNIELKLTGIGAPKSSENYLIVSKVQVQSDDLNADGNFTMIPHLCHADVDKDDSKVIIACVVAAVFCALIFGFLIFHHYRLKGLLQEPERFTSVSQETH